MIVSYLSDNSRPQCQFLPTSRDAGLTNTGKLVVSPVPTFEKNQHEDLDSIVKHGASTNLDLRNSHKLCVAFAIAVSSSHLKD